MSKRPFVIFGIFAVLCLVVLPFWALDKVGSSDAAPEGSVSASDQEGLELFQINCGACGLEPGVEEAREQWALRDIAALVLGHFGVNREEGLRAPAAQAEAELEVAP